MAEQRPATREALKVEAAVIGSGPGGYVCGIKLAQLGVKTAVVEREFLGGVCLNVGCIPSKAVITAASLFERMRHAEVMGLSCGEPRIDVAKMQEWKRGVVKKLTGGVQMLLEKNGARIVRGEARIAGPHAIDVRTAEGVQRIEASKAIVVATGARDIAIPALKIDEKHCLSYRGALDLEEVPKRLLVVGGGVIGLELGTAWAKLGAKLTVVELLDTVLPGTDKDLVRWVVRKLKGLGADIFTKSKATGYEVQKDGAVAVACEIEGKAQTIVVDKMLVAVGFKPNSSGLGLEEVGVELDRRGHVVVDKQLRSNVESILAIGDVSGPPYLAHKASREGIVAAEVIAGRRVEYDVQAMPAATFTDPEISTVGLTEEQAREQGYAVKVGKFPFSALGRALTLGEEGVPAGVVKVVADQATGVVLGVHICGHEASDLIAEAAHAMEMGATVEDLALTVHPHPTLSEAVMEAAEAAHGKAIHIVS